jgi:hypothetical protein
MRDVTVENKGVKRPIQQQQQQLQQNISLTLSSEESYPWRSWQTNSFGNERKDIETWWTNQFEMST